MDVLTYWDGIYKSRVADEVSWYRPHLTTSIALVERSAVSQAASVVDVGGGASTLVDDLLARGFQNVSVLDASQVAIDITRQRLGLRAEQVHWIVADVT